MSATNLVTPLPRPGNDRQSIAGRSRRVRRDGSDTDAVEGIEHLLCNLDGAITAANAQHGFAVTRLHMENRHIQESKHNGGYENLRYTKTLPIFHEFFHNTTYGSNQFEPEL